MRRGSPSSATRSSTSALPSRWRLPVSQIVQLRRKGLEWREELALLRVLRERAVAASVASGRLPALISANDRADLAAFAPVDVLHLGQDDLPPASPVGSSVPRCSSACPPTTSCSWPPPPPIPTSTTSVSARSGTPRPRPAGPGSGWVCSSGQSRLAPPFAHGAQPWFVTGGVAPDTLDDVLATGARRVVVVRAITEAADPAAVAAELAGSPSGGRRAVRHLIYLAVLAGCLIGTAPLELYLRVRVYARWKRLLLTLAPVVVVFVAWDLYAISRHHWSYDRRADHRRHPARASAAGGAAVLPGDPGLCGAHMGGGAHGHRLVPHRSPRCSTRRALSYTALALIGLAVALVLDVAVLRTRLVARSAFWMSYAIIIVFQLITNGVLTYRDIVRYDPGHHPRLPHRRRAGRGPAVRLLAGVADAQLVGLVGAPLPPGLGGGAPGSGGAPHPGPATASRRGSGTATRRSSTW